LKKSLLTRDVLGSTVNKHTENNTIFQKEENMKRLLSVALMVLVSLVGMVGFSRAGNEVSALQASANATNEAVGGLDKALVDIPGNVGVAAARAKMYYLTRNSFNGGDAVKACDPRFHMASITEIQDPSNLQYAARSTPAYDTPPYDQVFGPPSDYMGYLGWVRTGSFPIEGVPDYCDYNMSSFDHQRGTTLALHAQLWGDPYNNLYPSYTETESQKGSSNNYFSHPQHVWCVGDPE
jgi:hypothetical protein